MNSNSSDGPQSPELQPDMQPLAPAPETTSAHAGPSHSAADHGASRRGSSAHGAAAHQGTFYSAPPGSSPTVAQATGNRWRQIGLAAVAAVGVGAALWIGLSAIGGSSTGPTIIATTQSDKTFAVAAVDADTKATDAFKAMFASGAALSPDVLDAVNLPALKALDKSAPKLAEEIGSGQRVLYRVYLLDFKDEDGDQVELSVDGMGLGPVALQNSGQAFLIPLARGKPSQLKLVGTADGGGGITVGFISSLGEAKTRVMQVGDFEQWTVNVQ